MEDLLYFGGGIIGLFIIICIISGFFKDLVNSIFCSLIGIAGIVFCIIFSSDGSFVEMWKDIPNENTWAWIFTIIIYVLFVVRYLPCVSTQTEKNTYLIFGTLIEDTESHILGLGTVFGIPLLFAVPYYFLSKLIFPSIGIALPAYAVFVILLIHSVIGFIRAIREEY